MALKPSYTAVTPHADLRESQAYGHGIAIQRSHGQSPLGLTVGLSFTQCRTEPQSSWGAGRKGHQKQAA
ncbi:MAG: hypothetical protein ACRD3T_09780 [Terriglobia bacterium]